MNDPKFSLAALLTRDLAGFAILLTVASGLGFFANQLRDRPLALVYESKEQRLAQAVTNIKEGGTDSQAEGSTLPERLELDEFKSFVSRKEGLVLDARPEIFHRLGHIPGSISLPRESFEEAYTNLKPVLESHKSSPIVVYCSSRSCEDSKLVEQALRSLGYQQVAVFTGGWAAWTDAGLPEEHDS